MKYPQKYGRDIPPAEGDGTMGQLAQRIADAIATGDEKLMCRVIDQEFIYGAWGHLLREEDDKPFDPEDMIRHHPHENINLCKDIRGLAIQLFREGQRRGAAQAEKVHELMSGIIKENYQEWEGTTVEVEIWKLGKALKKEESDDADV